MKELLKKAMMKGWLRQLSWKVQDIKFWLKLLRKETQDISELPENPDIFYTVVGENWFRPIFYLKQASNADGLFSLELMNDSETFGYRYDPKKVVITEGFEDGSIKGRQLLRRLRVLSHGKIYLNLVRHWDSNFGGHVMWEGC